jgi:prepilin-type N-terminal cleavage/methylation domain-containing protein
VTPNPHDRGFTLVETLVALALFASVVAGAATLAAAAARAALAARLSTSAMALARQKLDAVRALTFAVEESGAPITDGHTNLSVDPPATGGQGLAPGGSLSSSVSGFTDFLDRGGRWVAGGTAPPPGAAFVRRWQVGRLAGSGDLTLVARVRVVPIVLGAAPPGMGSGSAAGVDLSLIALRTRARQ